MWGRDLKGGALKVESSPTFTESCPHSKRVDCFPTFKEGQDPQMSGFVKARGFEDAVTCTGEQEGGGSDHVPGYYFSFSMLYHKAPVAQMADIGFKVVLLERLNQKWKQKHF